MQGQNWTYGSSPHWACLGENLLVTKTYQEMKHQPFRNGDFLLFEGNLYDADAVLSWIMDEETLEIPGVIEEVGTRMLNR